MIKLLCQKNSLLLQKESINTRVCISLHVGIFNIQNFQASNPYKYGHAQNTSLELPIYMELDIFVIGSFMTSRLEKRDPT